MISLFAGFAMAVGSPAGHAQNYQPREINGVGDSARFPISIGIFERHRIFAYSAGLEDVSVGYNSAEPGYRSGSTIYFYPVYNRIGDAAANLELEFATVKAQISRYPGGRWVEDRATVKVHQDSGPVGGLSATYRFKAQFFGEERELFSELQLFVIGERFVKFRHTYPAEHREFLRLQIDNLMATLKWEDVDEEELIRALSHAL
ncbi:hypothetical protein [Pelagibius sp.]|uniref:hypothetical protein n=1 Tax=Pelagibius sp. TaxID=1931238 RepID=UPI003B50B990